MWVEKNGRSYRIRELIAGEKITLASGYETKSAALNAMTIMKADALRGDALVPRGGELTLADWVATWWPAYKRALKETSRSSIEGVINRYIVSMLGHLRLGELSEQPLIVQRWTNDLLDGRTKVKKPRPLANKTVRNAHGQLYVIMAAAITHRYVRHNPCEHTLLPEEDDDRDEMLFLTPEEADLVIQATPEHWRPLILLFMATGLRWSEAMGLRKRDIDLVRSRLHVRLQTVEVSGRPIDQTPKTKRGKRHVTFQQDIAEVLRPLLDGKKLDDRVFAGPKGGLIRRKEFYEVWWLVREAAGFPGLRLHDLRHTHVAWLIAANVPLSAISRRIGHKDIGFTDQRYGHLLPEVDEGVVAAVEAAMRKIDFRGNAGELVPA
ncbi:tyrosine-type recombinase/integrase [Micromonospora craniellae]|uniref:Site-specific integrase n=1 Tax=Micromonospora craniellae TaxID=2294034 RepID=A0A372G278_9ACTN|nr:site-specific integrase [Micromonospora craniellae]QOC89845.1 site-specific integrase [Micromonospora craniellae]RFS46994.1 site-specific integrase [Micromonospora craniellae]